MADHSMVTINISTVAVLKVIGVLIAALFLYVIRDIVAMLFIALILAAAILPAVEFFERRHLPRWSAILIVYVGVFALVSVVIGLLVPALTVQMSDLSANFPRVYERFLNTFEGFRQPIEAQVGDGLTTWVKELGSQLANTAGDIISSFFGFVGGIVTFFGVMVLTFYILLQHDGLEYVVRCIMPKQYQNYSIQLLSVMQDRIALWLRGQLILSLIIGVLTFIGLEILGVKFALILALVAAITEIVPYLGPILGSVPALFIAFTQSPTMALFVLGLYVIVQQVENHFIVPRVMNKVTGLNPVVVILAILIGGKVGGIVGAIIAIPLVTVLAVVFRELFGMRCVESSSQQE